MEKKNKKSIRAEIVAGTTVVLLLVAGTQVWAGKHGGQIQLKKDAPVLQEQQLQEQRETLDPFRDMLQLQREMERVFGNVLNPYSGFPEFEPMFGRNLQQAMDLRELPDAFVVQMDLPGMDKSDINIEVRDHILTVKAERHQATEKKDEKILMQERSVNAFSREVVLPQGVDPDAVSAEYKAGVLTITLPKVERDQKIHKVEIK